MASSSPIGAIVCSVKFWIVRLTVGCSASFTRIGGWHLPVLLGAIAASMVKIKLFAWKNIWIGENGCFANINAIFAFMVTTIYRVFGMWKTGLSHPLVNG